MVQSSTRHGLSATRVSRIGEMLQGAVQRGDVPGTVALVSRNGELYVESAGTMAFGSDTPVSRDTIFRIASMTKPIIAAAVMTLVEECLIRLDEPVDRLLPELANRQVLRSLDSELDDVVPAERPIKVRDVLNFTAGYGMIMDGSGPYPITEAFDELGLGYGAPGSSEPPGADEWIRRLGTLPLMHQPGERWLYNMGSDILGVLVERAAGKPLETLLRERIFDPLGMVDTGFSVPPDRIHRLPVQYLPDFQTGEMKIFDLPDSGFWSRPPSFPSGAGGLVSTADDFHTFARMLLNMGQLNGTRILSRPAVETMLTDHLTPEQKQRASMGGGYFDSHGWGFGVGITTRRETMGDPVGSYSWSGGLGTHWSNDPAEGLTIILLTQVGLNSAAVQTMLGDIQTLAYQAIDD